MAGRHAPGEDTTEDEPIIRQHLAKFDKLFPALALVFHLVDCAAHGVCGPVSKEAALRAAAWCEYLEAHARRCYGLLKDDGMRAAQALAAKLERGALEDSFTLRDVRRFQWRSLTTNEAIEAALDWLEDEDWLRSEATGGTGPGSGRVAILYGGGIFACRNCNSPTPVPTRMRVDARQGGLTGFGRS
jgi:Protein of unknown function (DUF3987)